MASHLDVVFARTPDSPDLTFVEVEVEGRSVPLGEWVDSSDGTVVLRIEAPTP
jgi:hypothetical protein